MANGYSDEALQIALDHNLTLIGNSDIHNPVDMQSDNPCSSGCLKAVTGQSR